LRKVVRTVSVIDAPKRGLKGFSGRLFIANSSADTVTFLNSLDVVTRTISAGEGPIGLAGDEDRNRLYITSQKGDTVSVLDPKGQRVLKELYVGKGPYGAVLLER
jgi:YVTN family beta-propeller protein